MHAWSPGAMAAPVSHRSLVCGGWACAGTWDVCQHTHWRDVAFAAWRDSGSLFESFSLHGGFSMCAIYVWIGATCVSWPCELTGSCGDRMCWVRCVDVISIPQLGSPGTCRRLSSFSPQVRWDFPFASQRGCLFRAALKGTALLVGGRKRPTDS